MQRVVLPILDANMTHGVIRAWFKREGDTVHAGEPLFEVETDKVNAEVEAEASGVVRQIVATVGTRVPVLGLLAFIGAADEALPLHPDLPPPGGRNVGHENGSLPLKEGGQEGFVDEEIPLDPPLSKGEGTATPGRVAASPAARRLARARGIALERIRGTGARGEITRADVDAASASPAVVTSVGTGVVDPAFLALLRRDTTAFRALASDTKVALYREHGARIGEHVRLEPGSFIVAGEIIIGTAASIGADSTIECDRLQLGRLAAFGRRTRVRCRSVEIGDALWSKDDVVIGGGGSEEPGARLRAGDACFFGEGAYLNTCHPLTLGDEVCIGSRAMLFTHSHWQSVLRGYPALFGPIDIGDHVFIGNNAFVFAGVSIGAGATVMVNSFVAVNVAPDTLVGGVPAQVIRHVVAPTPAEQTAIVRERLLPELAAALRESGYGVTHDADTLRLADGAVVRFVPEWTAAGDTTDGRTVILTCAANAAPPPETVTVFELIAGRVSGMQDELSDEVRELCRRRGIRFRPFAWRHGVGHFEGERFVRRAPKTR